jgi:hypothetical protein
MSKNHDLGFDSSRVAVLTRDLCFLLPSVPLTAAARESGAWERLPKTGALRRVRRLERMPDRFDRVGERPAAAGAEEVMVGSTEIFVAGASERGVKTVELERRGLGVEKGLAVKADGLQRPSSLSGFFRFGSEALHSTGSTFSESDSSRVT